MQHFFFAARILFSQEISRLSASLFCAATLAALAGCGSGSIVEANDTTGGTTTGTETPVTTTAPTLTLALTNSAGETLASISGGAIGTLKATLKNASGALIPNATVIFEDSSNTTASTLVTISPAKAALTDASGVATVTLSPRTNLSAGAVTIRATAQVGNEAITGSIGFAVGSAEVTVTAPVFGVPAATLSAFGTTSIEVTVSAGGVPVETPQAVTFSSICADLGKAVLSTSTVTAAGGIAIGSYRDNGCAGTDTITASAAGSKSDPTNLVVLPPATGSIAFVSASPSTISLKGIGGTEASLVSFRVLDTKGGPLSGKKVTFALSTTVGGIALSPSVAGVSDATSNSEGLVVITVNSGTVSTPVRVTASTTDTSTVPATTLTTQSNGLTITTGIPDQDSFSLGATALNPEFMDIDGNTTVLTVRLADHFNNPVPDGTAVNFTTGGGSIVASCSTTGGLCNTTLTSQDPRPANGRVTVLAYSLGEESFIDLNGNGVADLVPNEMVDINAKSTDMPEAWRDDNQNGVFDAASETFVDFNQNGVYDVPDGKYNGVLCDSAKSSPGSCGTTRSIHVRKDLVIVFSGSTAVISKIAPAGTIDLVGACSGTSVSVDLRIVDAVGNPMPAGTTIAVTTTDGTISGNSTFTQTSTNVTPAAGVANYSVSVRDDGALESILNPITGVTSFVCTDSSLSGVLTVTVTTPGGTVTTAQYPALN